MHEEHVREQAKNAPAGSPRRGIKPAERDAENPGYAIYIVTDQDGNIVATILARNGDSETACVVTFTESTQAFPSRDADDRGWPSDYRFSCICSIVV